MEARRVVVLITADVGVRLALRPTLLALGYTVVDAVDGLHGLDLVRQQFGTIALILLDAQLPPGLDGYDTCLRLVSLCYTFGTRIPIIPLSSNADDHTFFATLGCASVLLKPCTRDEVRAAIFEIVAEQPLMPLSQAMLAPAHRKACATEHAERVARNQVLRAALFASSPAIRAGLHQLLLTAGVVVTYEAATPQALASLLSIGGRPHLIVCDADGRYAIASVAQRARLPLLVVAVSWHQRVILLRDTTLPTLAHSLVDVSGEDGTERLSDVVQGIAHGQRSLDVSTSGDESVDDTCVPAMIMQQLAPLNLTRQQCALVWLDYQGWSSAAIAEYLLVRKATVQSYWKRVQQRTGWSRDEVKAWVRKRLDMFPPPLELYEQAVSSSPCPKKDS